MCKEHAIGARAQALAMLRSDSPYSFLHWIQHLSGFKKKECLGHITGSTYECVTLPIAKIMAPMKKLSG